jgi:hypothetical protein
MKLRPLHLILAVFLIGGMVAASFNTEVRKAKKIYKASHPTCEICGSARKLQIHHVVPVSEDRSLAADTNNLITLCYAHHYFPAHCYGHFKMHNTHIREAAAALRPQYEYWHQFCTRGDH